MKRRIVILTEAQWDNLRFGARYAAESCIDAHGDITPALATRIDYAIDILIRAPELDPTTLADDLATILHAASENSCSCHESQAALSGEGLHASDCWNSLHKRSLDRLHEFRELLSERGGQRVKATKGKQR